MGDDAIKEETMTDKETHKKLDQMTRLLAANLLVMTLFAGAIIFGLLPKVQRALDTSERVEARFQSFADEVEPVLIAGAGKATQVIKDMDTEKLTKTATEKADDLLEKAANRVERILDKDKGDRD